MERLPETLHLEILSRLKDSANVARCRVSSKSFDEVYPLLRSISLQCTLKWYLETRPILSNPQDFDPDTTDIRLFKWIFLDMIDELNVVESVRIGIDEKLRVEFCDIVESYDDDLLLAEDEFLLEWLPIVSKTLKSLTISDLYELSYRRYESDVMLLVSEYCRNLVELKLKNVRLSPGEWNIMPKLTSLTLNNIQYPDKHINHLSKCFPNLQVLNMIEFGGQRFKLLKIQLPNLKTCNLEVAYDRSKSITLITPNLITLRLKGRKIPKLHVEAPMLSHFHLSIYKRVDVFIHKEFENLKTLCIESSCIDTILLKFPITKMVENLTLNSPSWEDGRAKCSQFTLEKIFTVFPNVSSLCINSRAWFELETCCNKLGWEALDGRKGLKTFCAYVSRVDPSLTFSSVSCVLDQCIGLSDVSLLFPNDHVGDASNSLMSKCLAQWPTLKWRWGIWKHGKEDSWITDCMSH